MSKADVLPRVLYEDEALLALDKPSGLLAAPDRWDKDRHHLMRWVHERWPAQVAIVRRLDRPTSGVVLCAKTPAALQHLQRQFDGRAVRKSYLAIVRGSPVEDHGLVDAPLGEDPRRVGGMRISSRGKESRTQYQVQERWKGYALLRALPLTGRTHQVRVHLAHLGCPVLGDDLYGDGQGLLLSKLKRGYKHTNEAERPLIGRLALHAESLAVVHPTTGQEITLQAPLPRDFQIALKYLRRFGV